MKKAYLSSAAHAVDNPTMCPMPCSENTHCKQYMDIVHRRLRECGIYVIRNYTDCVGDDALKKRVKDANKCKCDLYYVAHTNAGGGRYSMTMCWNDEKSFSKALVFAKYRKSVKSHKVVKRNDLYEIRGTHMPCIYDELFFHDNAEDCAWFHDKGMYLMAEETCKAICEILNVKYTAPVSVCPHCGYLL